MAHIQVKFTHPKSGAVIYGIADTYSENGKAALAHGHLIVEDSILLDRYEVPESSVTDIHDPYPNEYDRHVDAALDAAIEVAKTVRGVQPGALVACPVGDGYAWYVVTKTTAKTATLAWRGFCQDRWTDRIFQSGGKFPLDIVARCLFHP